MNRNAGVSELADDRDSKSRGEIRVGSSPTTGIRIFSPELHGSGLFSFAVVRQHSIDWAYSIRSRSTTVCFAIAWPVRTGIPAPSRAKSGRMNRKGVRFKR